MGTEHDANGTGRAVNTRSGCGFWLLMLTLASVAALIVLLGQVIL